MRHIVLRQAIPIPKKPASCSIASELFYSYEAQETLQQTLTESPHAPQSVEVVDRRLHQLDFSYYEVLWSSAHQPPSVDSTSKVVEALYRLCGPASEEYRRSHWHLTLAWRNIKRWRDIADGLGLLV
jgi:hypothetical protein